MISLPESYEKLANQEVYARIQAIKDRMGGSLAVLGHHYQREEVIQFADYRGDSLGLSRRAAQLNDARFIVFCGVYFMAETAAILCKPEQTVVQPVAEALCPMARLANADEVQEAWEALSTVWGDDLIPITYQNSIAELKALVGRHGGAVCTSSNAEKLLSWAWERKGHILFTPDEHLGTNTALAMGVPDREIGLWDSVLQPDPIGLADCRIVVWSGYCYVHARMTPEDVELARQQYPDALLVVHPECPREVVARSDASGSTAGIIQFVEQAPKGATIVVGTEWNLVDRLNREHPDKLVVPLAQRTCRAMGLTTARHLLKVLEDLERGEPTNVVQVDEDTANWARVALERMLEVS
jgi:quinolinate synthase